MTARGAGRNAAAGWRFLSNRAQVLICIARDPDIRLRDVAVAVGITERAVQRIVADLAASGHIEIERARAGATATSSTARSPCGIRLRRTRTSAGCSSFSPVLLGASSDYSSSSPAQEPFFEFYEREILALSAGARIPRRR